MQDVEQNPCQQAGEVMAALEHDKREALAALEHDQWAHWTGHMLDVLEPLLAYGRGVTEVFYADVDAKAIKSLEALQRWERQIQTPYADLTEKEKDSDREWADKVLTELDRAAKSGEQEEDTQHQTIKASGAKCAF